MSTWTDKISLNKEAILLGEADAMLNTLPWMDCTHVEQLKSFIETKAEEPGSCYMRMLYFCQAIPLVPLDEARAMMMDFHVNLGLWPNTQTILTEMIVIMVKACEILQVQHGNNVEEQSIKWHESFNRNKMRQVVRVENNIAHIERNNSLPICDCDEILCSHGWSYRFLTTVTVARKCKIGASGFNLDDFYATGLDPVSEDDETDTVEVGTEEERKRFNVEREKAGKKAAEWEKRNNMPRPLRSALSVEDTPKKHFRESDHLLSLFNELRKTVDDLATKVHVSEDLNAERKITADSHLHPDDSSSNIGRYARRFLEDGTILTLKPTKTEADMVQGRKVLLSEDMLVKGYYKTRKLEELETNSVSKLRPINGLPRPFTSARLNFLSNLHTGSETFNDRVGGSWLQTIEAAHRGPGRSPPEQLLHQVLQCSYSMEEGIFVSNAFNLPYLEIGMRLNEENMLRVFALLKKEYELLWFQEMKDVRVPDFHSGMRVSRRGETKSSHGSRRATSTSPSRKESKGVGRSRTILGLRT